MKKLLLILLSAFIMGSCASVLGTAHPSTPSAPTRTIHETIRNSIVRITQESSTEQYVCTGFSIAPKNYLTAAHCTVQPQDMEGNPLTTELRADGVKAFVVKQDVKLDLAIIVADFEKPSVNFRTEPLQWLEHVSAMGYGEGFMRPLVTSHRLVMWNYTLGPGIAPGNVYMDNFIGGMSGGPCYDDQGDIVGIVQRASDDIGYGVDVATLLAFISS